MAEHLSGAPFQYVSASGFANELMLCNQIIDMSPLDQLSGPRLDALGWVDWEIGVDPSDYLEMLWEFHARKRMEWIKRIKP